MAYIFDIDGTIADAEHRMIFLDKAANGGRKNYPEFYRRIPQDTPIPGMVGVLIALLKQGKPVVFMTGRPEKTRADTVAWLHQHVFSRLDIGYPMAYIKEMLYMRADHDHRQDTLVKRDLLEEVRSSHFTPIMAFEDRPRVAKMFQENGVFVALVGNKEDF